MIFRLDFGQPPGRGGGGGLPGRLSRTATGSYLDAFVVAGFVAVVAAFMALMIGRDPHSEGG